VPHGRKVKTMIQTIPKNPTALDDPLYMYCFAADFQLICIAAF